MQDYLPMLEKKSMYGFVKIGFGDMALFEYE